MFCPQCRSEYREGFTRCDDCDLPLVATLPPLPAVGDPSGRDLVTVFETGDPGLLAMAHSLLDESQVPHITQGEALQDLFGVGRLGTGFSILAGPVHIQVERERAEEVRTLLAHLEEDAGARAPGGQDEPDAWLARGEEAEDREPEV